MNKLDKKDRKTFYSGEGFIDIKELKTVTMLLGTMLSKEELDDFYANNELLAEETKREPIDVDDGPAPKKSRMTDQAASSGGAPAQVAPIGIELEDCGIFTYPFALENGLSGHDS